MEMETGLHLDGRFVAVEEANGRFRRLLVQRDVSQYADRVDFAVATEDGEPTRMAADLERIAPTEGELLRVTVKAEGRHDTRREKTFVNLRGLSVERAADAARTLLEAGGKVVGAVEAAS